jgi:hypothetical protein
VSPISIVKILDRTFAVILRRPVPVKDFAFSGRDTKVFARLNRAELGDFDAFVFGTLLISQFKGQVIVPDFGFYGRESHVFAYPAR